MHISIGVNIVVAFVESAVNILSEREIIEKKFVPYFLSVSLIHCSLKTQWDLAREEKLVSIRLYNCRNNFFVWSNLNLVLFFVFFASFASQIRNLLLGVNSLL